uniref:Tetratricopeptide repeat domain 37 n=1 Tax=Oryzias latipes TaxID=8090 RepID=A0A3P9LZF4_ORYLA
MSSKEVKAALKSARDAIKNKEFKEALKHCKTVLKLEKSNYNAWVFIGLAACELEQTDQSLTAYKKAIELDPEQLLAWQGLANLYEKTDQWDFKVELPNVYQKLVELYSSSDKNKCYDMIKKLSDIYQSDREQIKVCNKKKKKDEYTCSKVNSLKMKGLNETEQDNGTHQHKAMALVEPVPGEEHKKISADYLKCLSKLPCEEAKIKEACESVLSLYPNHSYPLEVLCGHYLKTGNMDENAVSCFSRLQDLAPNSGLSHLGLGTKSLQEGRYNDAINNLTKGLKQMSLSTGWCSLAEAQFKTHRYSDCAVSCSQGLSHFNFGCCVIVNYIYFYCKQNVRFSSTKPKCVCFQIPEAEKEPSMLALKGRAYLNKGQIDRALQVNLRLNLIYILLKAVSHSPNTGEYYFLLGKLYWEMGPETRKDRSKAHTHFLKAAKFDPHLGSAFRYLGHYYREVAGDRGRAQGCYKKAFELNGDDNESGAASVDLSIEQGDMETALRILQSVTEKATPGSAKWAWMRRGLYYLKVEEHQQAVADLQAALRADPEDWVCWECLGEAYLKRRSFTAALKAFSRAHQLQPSSIYSVYQAAAIKQTLGKFKEAAAEYLLITTKQDYVPALKGLGECQLSLAKSLMEDCRDGGAIDLIEKAIQNLFRAVQLRPDLSCLWKLLGDASTAVSIVSPNRAQVLVPASLAGLDSSSQANRLNQVQMLKVGERCYARALKLMPEAPSLWYDLGLNYYRQAASQSALTEENQNSPSQDLEKAQQCLKKSIMMDSGNYSYWNALGVVSMNKGLENFALAQHCFIKSIQVEPNNVVAWTNLGTLYLKKANIELAHEAFKIAQSLEPLYVNCWIGQALIAEGVGSYDTMDLFRHTTELSTHMEGVKGYAYWVCSTMLDKSNRNTELYRYNIVQMNAISAAQVALSKYTERIQSDPEAFTMLGYLNEHLHLNRQALQAYQRAVELLQSTPSSEELAFSLGNYGRALCNLGQLEEAVHAYNSTPLQDLSDLVGLALAYCRSGLLQESIATYERALAVASSEKEKAYLLTALALLQHRHGNLDPAKTLLFKCSMLKEPISESLLCLCALGLVHSDATLAAAALAELLKQDSTSEGVVQQQCLLTCALLALRGSYVAVQREASRAVHRYDLCCPLFSSDDPAAWAALMAACHTENTSCYLSGSAPCRQSLEHTLMSVIERPLAQSLEGWVLQQAVTGLMMEGQLDQAEALCTQVEHYTVLLSLRQVQCQRLLLASPEPVLPEVVLEQLNKAVLMNPTNLGAWHWLADVYRSQGLLVQAVMAYRQSLQLASQLGVHSYQVASLLRLALLALGPCMVRNDWKDLVMEATTEVLKLGSFPVAHLFQALLQFVDKMNSRETRRLLERLVYTSSQDFPVTVAQVASWYLLRHLHAKHDQELIDVLLQHAKKKDDQRLLVFHSLLTGSSS